MFQRACTASNLSFIGPSAEAIDAMGDKLSAIRSARKAGVPVIPSSGAVLNPDEARAEAAQIGYPCLIKASAGGGGRGMRVVRSEAELLSALSEAQAEAQAAFGDSTVYIEKFIEQARHIEIQILGDHFGNLVHLFERDCTVQRRLQKLIEEAPSPILPAVKRAQMAEAALALARDVGYTSAGTVEFIYDVTSERFYFLEMNTRIQVEHPVTEMITGVDLVREQLRIAAGESLSFRQGDISIRGHAIECRINAEDPTGGQFHPSPGKLTRWSEPEGTGIRVDTHCYEGYTVPVHYDSLLAKAIAVGKNRAQAIQLLSDALEGFVVEGVRTTIPLHRAVLADPAFVGAKVTTQWLETAFLPTW